MSQNWDDYGELCLEHAGEGTAETKQLVKRCLDELRKTGEEAEVRRYKAMVAGEMTWAAN